MERTKKSKDVWCALLWWALDASRKSPRQLSRLLGRSDDYVGYSRRNRKKGPTLDDAFRLIEAIGLPSWVVFGKLFPPPARPAEVLEQLWKEAGTSGAPAPSLVARVQAARAAIEMRELAPAEPPRRSRRDSQQSLVPAELETEIAKLLGACQEGPTIDSGVLGDLAFALALWGDAQRSCGDLDAASRACRLALDFAERSQDRWVLGQCLFIGALLIADLGYPQYALPWLEKAAALFAFEAQCALPELLAAQGLLLLRSGGKEAGRRDLREALRLLPPEERRWRHAALWQLATTAQEAGDFGEALARLDTLASELPSRDVLQGLVQWRRAKALLALDGKGQAIELFALALAQLGELGDPAAAVHVLCDAGEALVTHEESVAASQLAGILLGAWNKQALPFRLAELAEDLCALGRMRPLVAADIGLIRQRLDFLHPGAGDFQQRVLRP